MHSNLAKKSNSELGLSPHESLFDRLGGRKRLEQVHKRFYDKIVAHPVLGAFFANKAQQFQEDQQTDFMTAEFGGPKLYGGRLPDGAHQHLFITNDHFELRSKILADTLDECGVEPELRDQWLVVDRRFKNRIVKKNIDECKKRFPADHIVVPPES